VDVTSCGEVLMNLTDTDGDPFTVRFKNDLYVPGLIHIISSVSQFAKNNNIADIVENFIYVTFTDRTVICPLFSSTRLAFNTTIAQNKEELQAPGTKLETSGLSHWKPFRIALVRDATIPSFLPQSTVFGLIP
jgi:hypothetical protein